MPTERTPMGATPFSRGFVLRWAALAVRLLGAAREQLDEANVFPVADSDTGSNLLLTVRGGAEALEDVASAASGSEAMRAFARGALLGARGNSGIIVSEFLRGFAGGLAPEDAPDPGEAADAPAHPSVVLAHCLDRAARAAYSAVADPVQGTILTTADGAASAAGAAASQSRSVDEVLLAARAGARAALARSPQELEVLERSGVLDAGAYGLTLVLEAAAQAYAQEQGGQGARGGDAGLGLWDLQMPELRLERAPNTSRTEDAQDEDDLHDEQCHEHGDGEFEVMFLLEKPAVEEGSDSPATTPAADPDPVPAPAPAPDTGDALRGSLARIGRSVVVVGGDGMWQAHVHTDDPAATLACQEYGRMRQVCIRHLSDPSDVVPVVRAPGVVVGTSSPGLIPDMARAGAVVLISPNQGWREDEIRRAVIDAGTPRVVILAPSGADAESARRLGPLVRDVAVEVLDSPTDLHTIVALTAAAELLDAVPSNPGNPVRGSEGFPVAMAESITGLGHTIVLNADGGADGGTGEDMDRAIADLPGLGSLGLALLLHGDEASQEFLTRCEEAITAEFGGAEVVALASGTSDALVRIGVL